MQVTVARGSKSRVVAALGLTGALLALAAFLPSTSRTQFVFAGNRSELGAMGQAIDRVVDQLNIFIREIARGEIRRRIDAEQRIRVAVVDEETLTVAFDDWGPVRLSVDGSARRVRGPDGENVRASVTYRYGRLIERRIAPRGSRVNVLTLSPDAQRLHMQVRIASDQLPDDIAYRLTYRRAD
jgi:hypothetical protein